METLEGCEGFLIFVFAGYALVWISHFTYSSAANPMIVQERDRWLLWLTPILCGVGLFIVLLTLGDPYVRSNLFYLAFYWVWGVAWVAAGKWLFPFLGFSVMDDGLERRNTAATLAICGGFIGLTLTFAGGNVGEGPGWWIVLLCVCVSTGVFLLGWFALEFATQISETITIERNMAAGIRLAVLLILMGFLLGRAVSGNWIDMQDFIDSFIARAWYVIPLLLVAVGIEWAAKPSVNRPRPDSLMYGALPGAAYVVIGILSIVLYNNSLPR